MSRKTDELLAEQKREREMLDEQLAGLRKQLRQIQDQLSDRKELLGLTDDIVTLKTTISDLEISKSKLTEAHEREKRETLHMVGLEKKRSAFETESARKEAQLEVREENLEADKKRFDEHVKFIEDRFEQHMTDMREIVTAVLGKTPNYTGDLTPAGSPPATRRAPVRKTK